MKSKKRVTINTHKFIPGIGKGPIVKPIYIDEDLYRILLTLGFKVSVHGIELDKKPVKVETSNSSLEEVTELDKVEEEILEEVVELEEEELTELEEEVVELDEIEEETAEVEETEGELDFEAMTKKQLKDYLDSKGISYTYNATLPELKDLAINA